MNNQIRIYYYFIIGAVGGLTGWLLGSLLLRGVSESLSLGTQSVTQQILYGAVLGATIGLAIAGYEGIASRSWVRFAKYGGIGLLLGAVAGALALPLAQALYGSLIATGTNVPAWKAVLVGTLCWLLFGGLIGLGEGVSKGTQIWKGGLGGVCGGLLGGLSYEINRVASDANTQPWRKQFLLALGVMLLGAAIGAAVALITEALKQAWVEVLDGKFANRTFDVTKYVDPRLGSLKAGSIGSDQWEAHIYLPGDGQVLPQHAEISFTNGAPTLTVTAAARKMSNTLLNGRNITVSPLSDGDRLQIGATRLVYRNKRK